MLAFVMLLSPSCSAERLSGQMQVQPVPLPGSARARVEAAVGSKLRVLRVHREEELGKGALPSPVTTCTSPQILRI